MHRVVPELIVENYRAGRYSGEFPAVGMFLDLSGFSNMTDALMQHGQHGAEVLANLMHGVFDPLVEGIFEYGGKIVGFAGDGIMALFPIDEDAKATALSALTSAWLIQQRLQNDPGRSTLYGKFQFTAKIGLTCGEVSWGILHSEDRENATYYFRGSAVDDSAKAEHQSRAGQIILTPAFDELLNGWIETESHDSFRRFVGFNAALPIPVQPTFPPVDLEISRVFMPEEIIAQDARGEFRQVVNLFIRFPDLTHDQLKEVIRVVFNLRRKYGGLINRVDFGDKGCNMLMLWGAPVAYENDINRCLNFVLDMQVHLDFPVTAGVTYYVAHAGYLGSVMCEDYTCYGWGVNLASRFMMSAPTGDIWVDDRIARRVSTRFEVEFIGQQRFKGFSAEQRVHRLKSYNPTVDPVYQGEIIGREKELVQLDRFVEPLWRGQFAGVIMVLGDAGIGKGHLAQAFRASELFEQNKALWAMCQSEQILRQSFNPFRSWLLHYFKMSSSSAHADRQAMFDSKLNELIASTPDAELAQELDRLRSVLGALLDIYWSDSLYEILDAQGRYNSTLQALITFIKAESLRQPVIIFIDDVQFIDEDSLHLLPRLKRALLAGQELYPVAMIATSRVQSNHPLLTGDLVDAQIKLFGLPREAVARYVEILLGGVPALELVNLVNERSEGNPYFVEQIIRYLQEENLIEMSAQGWNQVSRIRDSFLPGDIGAVLVARLDQLSRKVKEVVQTASVFGREFMLRVLNHMVEEWETLEQYVMEAEQSAIWVGQQDGRYIFTHGLLRDAAYTMQMRARRQQLHSQAVKALEEIYAEELPFHYPELAHHSERAEQWEKALQYYSLAGKDASAVYQNSKGIEYFTRAISFTSTQDVVTKFDLLVDRVELFNRLGKRDQQMSDLNSLENIAALLNDPDRMATVMMLRAAYFYFMSEYKLAIEHARRAREYSESLTASELGLYTQVVWFMALLYLGRAEDAMQHAQYSLDLSRRAGNRKEEGRILTAMGLIALESKEPASALHYLEDAVEIARQIKDPGLEARALNNLAKAEGSVHGNYARAQECYEESYRLLRMVGDRHGESVTLSNIGFCAAMQGDFQSARAFHEQSLRIAREVGSPASELIALVNLSAVASLQNDSALGLQFAMQAAELARKTSQRSWEGWAMLYMGHAYLAQRDVERARAAYQSSVEIRVELDQPSMSMEPIAGLVETYLYTEDLESAAIEAEKILRFLGDGFTLDGTEEPLRIYYACYLFLEQKGDPRSSTILDSAKQMLEAQVSKFGSEDVRKRYIENIPWRRAIWEAAHST